MKPTSLVSLITIIALLVAVFFVFGINQLESQLCPDHLSSGICGFLVGLTHVVNNIMSLNVFLVLILPLFISFSALLVYKFAYLPTLEPIQLSYVKHLPTPEAQIRQLSWLSFHINSPTL